MANSPNVRVEDREIVFYYLTKSEIQSLKANTIIGDIFFAVASVILGAAFTVDGPIAVLFIIVGCACLIVSFVYYWLRSSLTKGITSPRSPGGSVPLKEQELRNADSSKKKKMNSEILKAEYGANGTWIDVTNRLREALAAGGIVIVSNGLAGQDPIPGTVKFLRVQFKHEGETYQKDYKETTPVELPAGVS